MGGQALKLRVIEDGALVQLITGLPFSARAVIAGFPSPADDHLAQRLDLNSHLIKNPDATYFVRVEGDSMKDVGINSGDILIVDRSIEPADNRIIIACIDGELIVKRIRRMGSSIYLMPENSRYKSILITPEMDFEIWGVVIHVIHSLQ